RVDAARCRAYAARPSARIHLLARRVAQRPILLAHLRRAFVENDRNPRVSLRSTRGCRPCSPVGLRVCTPKTSEVDCQEPDSQIIPGVFHNQTRIPVRISNIVPLYQTDADNSVVTIIRVSGD